MRIHHQEAIDKFVGLYKNDPSVLALLLCGSIAHGFDEPESDIDICIVITPEEYEKKKSANKLAFSVHDICEYPNGYIDCKIADVNFLEKIAKQGSDAIRYAFKNNTVLHSKIENIQILLNNVARYPTEQVDERRKRFASQLLAWKWYYSEAIKKDNKYLEFLAIQKLVLFSSRIVLNENKLLYPFHKWMLRVVETAEQQPDQFAQRINELLAGHSLEKVNQFCEYVFNFIDFTEKTVDWPNHFLKDSEKIGSITSPQ